MIIAVASGKGGTGKTTVALALATAEDKPVRLLDCDVEEPNCHLFLKTEYEYEEAVNVMQPEADESRCDGCGICGRFCQYNAIAVLGKNILIFPELCHSCGGCVRVCPNGALREIPREIGRIEFTRRGNLELITGQLTIGRAMSPPLIRAVKKHIAAQGMTVIDCPPGTSCPVVTAVRGADFVILVTEPTPFGLHDLRLAVATVRELGLRFGVVLNRADSGDRKVQEYCQAEKIPLLLEIADRRAIAEAYSRGIPLLEAVPTLKEQFGQLTERIGELCRKRINS